MSTTDTSNQSASDGPLVPEIVEQLVLRDHGPIVFPHETPARGVSALSDKIAAEHILYRCTEDGGTGVYGQPVEVYVGVECECGWTTQDSAATSQHVADVTERAVRDAIAQQLENLEHTRAMTQDAIFDGYPIQWVEGHDHAIRVATALAREGTTP